MNKTTHLRTLCTVIWILYCQNAIQAQDKKGIQCATATEPTYQYLEAIQRAAYEKSPGSYKFLLEERKRFHEDLIKLIQDRTNQPNSLGLPPLITPEDAKRMESGISQVKLHTCLEDPRIYFMIQGNINAIEQARKELGFRLSVPPKFGSLPTEAVNAYTFYYQATKERVIGFNNEFFRFAFIESQLAVSTIPQSELKKVDTLPDATDAEVITQFFINPLWHDNNNAAIRSFLHLPTSPLSPSFAAADQAYQDLSMPLQVGMILFTVGHEYGHVINRDIARIHPPDSSSVVSARTVHWTWPQELAADEIGTRLAAQALEDSVKQYPIYRNQWLYALHGAILFMNCLSIIDDAKFIQSHNTLPTKLTEQQKNYLRQFANGKITGEQVEKLAGIKPGEYPPAWLRSERIKYLISQIASNNALPAEVKWNGRIADAIVTNMNVFWAMSRTDFQKDLNQKPTESLKAKNSGGQLAPKMNESRQANSANAGLVMPNAIPATQDGLPPPSPPSELILWRGQPLPETIGAAECVMGKFYVLDPDSPYLFGHFSGAFAAEVPRKESDGTFAVTKAGGYIATIRERSEKGWVLELARGGQTSIAVKLGDYPGTEGAILVGVTRTPEKPCQTVAPDKAIASLRSRFPSLESSSYIILRIVDWPTPPGH
jgi:hypothetical protein